MKFDVEQKSSPMEKISVVIPVFNGEKTLNRSLMSIKNQTVPVEEVVVVNDGSTDSTEEIVDRFADYLPIKHIRNVKNMGIQSSLRRGVECSTGTIIFRLDSDDYWANNHVESLIGLFSTKGTVLASSRALYINKNGEKLGVSKLLNSKNIRGELIWDNPLVHSATAFRKSAYQRVGGYELGVRWEDYNLWIKLLSVGDFCYCSKPTIYYTSSSDSLSSIDKKQAIIDRWVCQRQAYRTFLSTSPVTYSVIFAKSFVRKSVSWFF